MSKFLTLIQEKNKNKTLAAKPKTWLKFFLSVKSLNILVVALICLGGALYLAQINGMAIKGFAIKELDEKRITLKDEIRKLEFQTAELQSGQKIQERIAGLEMVSVAKVDYARDSGTVAVK